MNASSESNVGNDGSRDGDLTQNSFIVHFGSSDARTIPYDVAQSAQFVLLVDPEVPRLSPKEYPDLSPDQIQYITGDLHGRDLVSTYYVYNYSPLNGFRSPEDYRFEYPGAYVVDQFTVPRMKLETLVAALPSIVGSNRLIFSNADSEKTSLLLESLRDGQLTQFAAVDILGMRAVVDEVSESLGQIMFQYHDLTIQRFGDNYSTALEKQNIPDKYFLSFNRREPHAMFEGQSGKLSPNWDFGKYAYFPSKSGTNFNVLPSDIGIQRKRKTLKDLVWSKKGKLVDKWEHYLDYYEEVLSPRLWSIESLLEIGVQNGGGIDVWLDYFPKLRKVVGVDVEERCESLKFAKDVVDIVLGEAQRPEVAALVRDKSTSFDLIIDDASHVSHQVIDNFINYFPMLSSGGIYIIEDVHTSYWQEFEGGLKKSSSQVNFFKHLVDFVNHEHWEKAMKARKWLTSHYTGELPIDAQIVDSCRHIYDITFSNSMIVLRKSSEVSALGHRLVIGDDASVTTARDSVKAHHMSTVVDRSDTHTL